MDRNDEQCLIVAKLKKKEEEGVIKEDVIKKVERWMEIIKRKKAVKKRKR